MFKVSDQNGSGWHRRNLGHWWSGWGQQLWMLCIRLGLAHGRRRGKSLWVFQKRRTVDWSYQAALFPCDLLTQSDPFCVLQL